MTDSEEKMSVKYITIEREYGSGGRDIAKLTAEKCGIKCYGREILELVAKENNMPVSSLEMYEENTTGSFLYSMFVMSQAGTISPDMLSDESKLFLAESQMIKKLAEKGPAIFVGRCAAFVLRNENKADILRVFIRANPEYEQDRISNVYGIKDKNVVSLCKRVNRRRANYYEYFTNSKWKDLNNYDIVLDSSRLGIEASANALAAIFFNR